MRVGVDTEGARGADALSEPEMQDEGVERWQ